jgi:hypothetical protein
MRSQLIIIKSSTTLYPFIFAAPYLHIPTRSMSDLLPHLFETAIAAQITILAESRPTFIGVAILAIVNFIHLKNPSQIDL